MTKWRLVEALLAVCLAAGTAGADSAVKIAHLGDGGPAWSQLVQAFEKSNPGYKLRYEQELSALEATSGTLVAFVQEGEGKSIVHAAAGETRTDLAVGDIVVLRRGERAEFSGGVSGLIFDVPDGPEEAVPPVVRPDWDPLITDTPGGCAEETGAYRRILLTWQGKVGPYLFHGLNAHRVRISDSFSHYHPVESGFDEFYLVQMLQPGARLLTSEQVDIIERPESVTPEAAATLIRSHELRVGDLVYLPRGTMHRGVGGILAQVITAPGFRPGAEIGLDHHLRAINERLGLTGGAALPYHAAASDRAVVK